MKKEVNQVDKYPYLAGGGNMGTLIRAKDWSETPLGNPDTWPASLRTMVSVMLNNPFGMYIAWGKDYTQIYNDGYRPILGEAKHPQALGISTRETFAEVWHIIGPMFASVMEGEAVGFPNFMLPLNRNGYIENCYFDFAYSPIRLDDGKVGGVLVTVIETTSKKKAEDELQENKNELEFVIEAAQLGTFDYNPITNKFSGNARLKNWFGLPANEELELTDALNTISDDDKERVVAAIQQVLQFSSGGIYDVEYNIINPVTKKETIVHAKGKAWFNEEKIAYRLNGTLEDITEKTLLKNKRKQTEENIRNMILESPVGICVVDAETLICEIVNDSFIEITGKTKAAFLNNYYWDTLAEAKVEFEDKLNKVVTTGIAYSANEVGLTLIRNGKDELVYVTFVYAPIKDEKEKVTKVAIWVLENTLQVQARNKIMVSENNLRLMILQAPMAITILREPDYKVEIVNKYALELWGRNEGEVLNRSIFKSMPELNTQGIKEILDEVVKTGKRFATAELPLQLLRNNKLETVYINFSYEALYNEAQEIDGIMAIGFDVTEQVMDRKKVEASEESMRSLVESAPFPIGVYTGEELRITLANKSIMDIWDKGYDVVGKLYTNILPELENQQIFEQIREVLRTGVPFHATNQRVDLLKNGNLKPYNFNYSFTPLYDASGKVYAVMNTAADVTELHQANQKIEASEKRFRDSVQQAPLGIAIFRGADFTVELANDAYLLLVDKKAADFIGQPLFTALPEAMEIVNPLFLEVMESGEPFYADELSVNLKRTGKPDPSFFNLLYHPLKEADGAISGIMVVATEVTATIKAKQLLEESEMHFRRMVMQSPIPMAILRGQDFIVESANKVMFQNVWHKKEEDVIGLSLLKVFPELKDQKFPAILKQVITTGIGYNEKEALAYVQGDDGLNAFYLDYEYQPLIELNGKTAGIIITVNDITDKVEARKKVEEAEARLRLAAEAAELATWELDLQSRNIIHTARLAEIFGHDVSYQLTHEEMRQQINSIDRVNIVEKAFEKALTSGVYYYEARLERADGNQRWIRVQGKTIYNDHQTPLKLVGTLRDVTEEKQYEQGLLEREQKFRLLADSMPQYIWTSDPEGNINYYNQSLYDYTGLTPAEIYNDGWQKFIHPDDREENFKAWMEAVVTGNDFLFEHRFRRYDGEYRWQLSRAIPQKDVENNIQMWVGSSTDIQNIKEQEEQKDFFMSMASHELKTPITSIKGYVQMLQAMPADNAISFLPNALKTMDRQLITLTKLISELLDISKIKSGGLDLNLEHFEISELLNEVVTEIKHINPQYEITVSILQTANVYADRDRIGQAIINFLNNAIKYSPKSKQIKTSCSVKEGKVKIAIQDFGIGIDKKEQDKIFDRFYRVEGKNEKTFPGFGIGLFISAEIIKKHLGSISLESEPGVGSVFAFELPVY